MLKKVGSKLLAKYGREVVRMPMAHFLNYLKIDLVLDVGANVGQYGSKLRRLGYRSSIESFEPVSKAFSSLSQVAKHDGNWNAHNFALGDADTGADINISAFAPSSSFLELSDNVKDAPIDLDYVNSEHVQIKKLDSVFSKIAGTDNNVLLKIDTQGFERNVIDGASNSLAKIAGVQMEVALVPHYEGESLIEDMIGIMRSHCFDPWWLFHGFRNTKTMQMIQTDIFFVRRDLGNSPKN